MKYCLFILLLCVPPVILQVAAPPASGAEIDSMTPRQVVLEDAVPELNDIINQRISAGVARANARQSDFERLNSDEFCNETILYNELRQALFQSFTASFGLPGYRLDQQLRELLAAKSYALPLRDSIYRDINYIEGFSLNLKDLSHVVNLDGQLVGLDKIGHFFAEGWHYFAMTRFDNHSLDAAMQWGRKQEEGKFGLATTGIFSYADLVANFNGWRFWNRVRRYHRDPLETIVSRFFSAPQIRCATRIIDSLRYKKRVRQWLVGAPFDLRDYLDGAWDEGNNCPSYKDPVIEHKVKQRIEAIESGLVCPCQPSVCRQAQKKYGQLARHLLHPSCLSVP